MSESADVQVVEAALSPRLDHEQEPRSSKLSTRVKQPEDTYGANVLRFQEELVQIEREKLDVQKELPEIERAKLLIKQQKHQVYLSSMGVTFTNVE